MPARACWPDPTAGNRYLDLATPPQKLSLGAVCAALRADSASDDETRTQQRKCTPGRICLGIVGR
eukprot:12439000-Alexandrium_andersonii.AAC.1